MVGGNQEDQGENLFNAVPWGCAMNTTGKKNMSQLCKDLDSVQLMAQSDFCRFIYEL